MDKQKILFIACLFLIAGSSCQDDFSEELIHSVSTRAQSPDKLDVNTAKAFYEQRIHSITLPKTGYPDHEKHVHSDSCSHENHVHAKKPQPTLPELKNRSNLVLLWDESRLWSDSLSSYVEIPLDLGHAFYSYRAMKLKGEKNMKFERVQPECMLVFEKKKESENIICYIVTLIGEKSYLKKNGKKMKQMRHKPVGGDFTGIKYHSYLSGRTKAGFYYTNGEITHRIVQKDCSDEKNSTEPEAFVSTTLVDLSVNTSFYSMKWENNFYLCGLCGEYHTIDGDNNCEVMIENCQYCHDRIEYCHCDICYHCNSLRPCSCFQACPDCYNDPCTCSYDDHCYQCGRPKELCTCNEQDPGEGGDELEPEKPKEPEKPDSLYVDKIYSEESTLTSEQKNKLEAAVQELLSKGKYYQILFDKLISKGVKIIFKVDLAGPSYIANFDKETNTIRFKYESSIIGEALREEVIHAVQYNCYYGKEMTSIYRNFDFEAKLYLDLICAISGKGCTNILTMEMVDDKEFSKLYNNFIGMYYDGKKDFIESDLKTYRALGNLWDQYEGSFNNDINPLFLLNIFK